MRILAVGAAAPSLRLAAEDAARGLGPIRRQGPGRGLRAGRRHPHPGGRSRARARSPRRASPRRRRRALVGHHPPAVRRRPEPRGARVRARALPPVRRRLAAGSPHSGMDALRRGGRRGRRGLGPGRARHHLRRARARARHRLREPAAAPVPPRSCSRAEGGTAAITARVTRTQPLLDRYRGDGESATRDLYDPRLFREEMFLPVVREVGEHLAAFDVLTWSLPDPDGRLGASVAQQLGATNLASPAVYAAVGDTARRGRAARRDRRTRRRRRRRDRRHRRRAHDRRDRHRGRTRSRRRRRRRPALDRAARDLRRGAAGPRPAHARRRDDPDGRPARERAVRPRAPRRCCSCSADAAPTAGRSTRPPSIHPALHRVRRHEARAGAARPARRGAHVHRQPDDAGAVRRAAADRGHRPRGRRPDHVAGRRRRPGPRDRHRRRAGAAPVRPRARRPGLRLEGPGGAGPIATEDAQ